MRVHQPTEAVARKSVSMVYSPTAIGPGNSGINPGKPKFVASGAVAPSAEYSSRANGQRRTISTRSEEHTSELQSHLNLVCRLLLEKKKKNVLTEQCTSSMLSTPIT